MKQPHTDARRAHLPGVSRMHAQVLIIALGLLFGMAGGDTKVLSLSVEENLPGGPRRVQAVETALAIEAAVDDARRESAVSWRRIVDTIRDYDSTSQELQGALDALMRDWLDHHAQLEALRGQLRGELDRDEWKAVFEDLEAAWFDR